MIANLYMCLHTVLGLFPLPKMWTPSALTQVWQCLHDAIGLASKKSGIFCPAAMLRSPTTCRPVVAHAFDPRIWEAVAGGSLGWRPAWSTE